MFKKSIAALLYPTDYRWVLYRLPFYINAVANGYWYYWNIRAQYTLYPVIDSRGYLDIAWGFAFVSWIISLAFWENLRHKELNDFAGGVYLAFCAVANIYYYCTIPWSIGPSS